jgi:hypothetical protein
MTSRSCSAFNDVVNVRFSQDRYAGCPTVLPTVMVAVEAWLLAHRGRDMARADLPFQAHEWPYATAWPQAAFEGYAGGRSPVTGFRLHPLPTQHATDPTRQEKPTFRSVRVG